MATTVRMACVMMFSMSLLLLAMPACGDTIVMANSQTEFSGTQGQNNWYFGSYSQTTGPVLGTFSQCPTYSSSMWTESAKTNLAVTSYGGRPSSTGAFWDAVHRWQVEATGYYQLSGVTKHNDTVGGTGTICYVFSWSGTTATEIWSRTVLPTDTTETAYTTAIFYATAGDYIDLAINSNGNSTYDLTTFNAIISQVPEPATLSIVGIVAVALLRRKSFSKTNLCRGA